MRVEWGGMTRIALALAGVITSVTWYAAGQAQIYDGQFGIEVIGVKKVLVWWMTPGDPTSWTAKATADSDLIVIDLEVKNVKYGKPDSDHLLVFSESSLEDIDGNKHDSVFGRVRVPRMPFAVPKGTVPKIFRTLGLEFDISNIKVVEGEASK